MTANQEKTIQEIESGSHNNFIVSMASQGGKSLCYQIPALRKEGFAIVFVPALALINDLLSYFNARNIAALSINSLNEDEWEEVKDELDRNDSVKFFLWTPEMGNIYRDLNARIEFLIKSKKVNYFVVDEAHYIDAINDVTSFGTTLKDRREESFRFISRFRNINLHIKWIALTTASEEYKNSLATNLGMNEARFLSFPTRRDNIFYKVFDDKPKVSSTDLVKKLLQKHGNVSGIIFCNSKKQLDNVVAKLKREGVKAIEYIGGSPQENIENWATGMYQVIVAKGESFGFGLNHFVPPSIRFVIHRYVPGNMHAYYHESGRIGNDGAISYAYIIKEGTITDDFQPYLQEKCRHQTLAEFFGETINPCGNMCDVCAPTNDL